MIEIKRQFDANPNLLIPNHPDRPDYDTCIKARLGRTPALARAATPFSTRTTPSAPPRLLCTPTPWRGGQRALG